MERAEKHREGLIECTRSRSSMLRSIARFFWIHLNSLYDRNAGTVRRGLDHLGNGGRSIELSSIGGAAPPEDPEPDAGDPPLAPELEAPGPLVEAPDWPPLTLVAAAGCVCVSEYAEIELATFRVPGV